MADELNQINFSLPISLVHNLSTAIKKRQQESFIYTGIKPTPGGATSLCLLSAKVDRRNEKVVFNFDSKSGFDVSKIGKIISCHPTDLKLVGKSDPKKTATSKAKKENVETVDDISDEDDVESVGEDEMPKITKKPFKRGGLKNAGRKSLRVVLEKLDVKSGKVYGVDSSEDNSEVESFSPSEDEALNKPIPAIAIGGRTRTGRVIKKPTKFLEEEDIKPPRGLTPKSALARTYPSKAASAKKFHRGLQLPPMMASKTAMLQSVQLKPVDNIGVTLEQDPPGLKDIRRGSKVLKKAKSEKGSYATVTLDDDDDDDDDDDAAEPMDEEEFFEEEDPDWDPIEEQDASIKKRKPNELDGLLVNKITPGSDRTPIGKRLSSLTRNENESQVNRTGRLADIVKPKGGNQLPRTPLVKIKPTNVNKNMWDDHDYLRQRETTQVEEVQTRQRARNGSDLYRKTDKDKTVPENDVDDGLNFTKTFMKQLAVPTIYNIHQVDTEYLELKNKRIEANSALKNRPEIQAEVAVNADEVPRIFRQVTFTSKGRPIRIQERKKKSTLLEEEEEKAKLEAPKCTEDLQGEITLEDNEKEVVSEKSDNVFIEKIEDLLSMSTQILDETMPSDLDISDVTFDDEAILEHEDPEEYVPVNEKGERIIFTDENGVQINLFDAEGNIKELFTEDGTPVTLVDESGQMVEGIDQPDYTAYDPNLKVESIETYEDYYDDDEDVETSMIEINEDEFQEASVDDCIDPLLKINSNNVPCEICFSFFLNNKNLLSHIRSKHRQDKHFKAFEQRLVEKCKVKCDHCNLLFDSDYKLMEHMQAMHEVEADFKCQVCGKGFMLQSRLLQHEKKVHRAIDQLCHLCPAVFKNPRSLEKHLESHTSGEWDKMEAKKICPHCKRKFDKPTTLQAHIKARHMDGNRGSSAGMISRCWTCQAEFSTAKDLRKHMIAEHVLHGHKYHCTLCKKVFDSMDDLSKHKTEIHSGGISLHCPFCGIGYMARHTLISHISNNHLNRETPYKCPFCPSKFVRAVFLQKHIGVVHDLVAEVEVRKGSCDDQSEEKSQVKKCIFEECDMTFLREKDVVEHILDSHKEHFPHECDICGQRFSKDKYVTSHAHAAHKSKSFLPPKIDEKKLLPNAPPTTGKLVQKLSVGGPGYMTTSSVTSSATSSPRQMVSGSPKVTLVNKTPNTPIPKKTILIDSSGRQISESPQTMTYTTTASTSSPKSPVRVHTIPKSYSQTHTQTTIQSQSLLPQTPPHHRTILGRSLVTGKPVQSFIPQTQAVQTQIIEQPVMEEQTVIQEVVQYPEFIVTTAPREAVDQNVDVEQIVYNLNVDPNPRAWHYSRIEDHAATLTISQEQTAVANNDAQSSINVVSAEELWRIINENIDS